MKKLVRKPLEKVAGVFLTAIPPKLSLSIQFARKHGKWPDLNNPRTFSEKLQYRKLHDNDARLASYSDKVIVKEIVAKTLGDEWIIPTLWAGETLPTRAERNWPKPYVLKSNYGSGFNLFIRSDEDEDWDKIEKIVRRWHRGRYKPWLHERHYEQIERKLFVEPLIGRPSELPADYKFFCFGGRAEFIMAQVERHSSLKIATYDREWTRQPFSYGYPVPAYEITQPRSFDRMVEAAESLARDFSFVRVDFYEIEGQPLFGEMTFYPGSGWEVFQPPEFNELFGRNLTLE